MEIIPVTDLPFGDKDLYDTLNFNPWHNKYTKTQAELGRRADETDRAGWRGYNRVYSKYISNLRNEKLNILEIGVHSGYSLIGWARYFKNSHITGGELQVEKWLPQYLKLQQTHEEFNRIKIQRLDSTSKRSWLENIHGTFDIIIDDGSHEPDDQCKTIDIAWEYLKPGGWYFVEDISNRYFNGGVEKVWDKLLSYGQQSVFVVAYSHYNKGWEYALSHPEMWKRYGITENTPKKAEDYIAVLWKK